MYNAAVIDFFLSRHRLSANKPSKGNQFKFTTIYRKGNLENEFDLHWNELVGKTHF